MPEVQSQDPFAEFDERIREDVDGLIWLGHLEDSFEFLGHHFTIRTLKGDEELSAGLVSKDYIETLGQAKAWAWARIALALVSVDHDENFCPPIGPDRQSFARARFSYCTSRWYWPLAEYIYGRVLELEARQLAALEAVQSLSSGSLPNFSPSASSWTEPGGSVETETETSTPSSTDS